MGHHVPYTLFVFVFFNALRWSFDFIDAQELLGPSEKPSRGCLTVRKEDKEGMFVDDCPLNEFCGYIDSFRRACLPCDQCYHHDVSSDEVLASCKHKCPCHGDGHCGPGSYCDFDHYDGGGKCRSCFDSVACTGPPNIFSHEMIDLCIASSTCDQGSFCGKIPTGNGQIGVCKSCDSGECAIENLQNELESCTELCPSKWIPTTPPSENVFCSRHEDCGGEGRWCSAENRCNECSPYCFPRVSPELDKRPNDFQCPFRCCDWKFEQVFDENRETTRFAVRPCETDLLVDGYWTRGDRGSWSVEEFIRHGTRCSFTSYDGQRMVTIIDCSDIAKFDVAGFRTGTLALIGFLATDASERRSNFFLDESFPHVAHYHGTLNVDESGVDRVPSEQGRGPSVMFILLIVILGGMAALIMLFCVGAVIIIKSQQGQPSLESLVDAETRPQQRQEVVPRDLVIDIMFPEQRFVVEEGDEDENRVCTICLRQIESGETVLTGGSCDHCYHRECIFEWMKCGSGHDFCPNCRRPLWTASAYAMIQETLLAIAGFRRAPNSLVANEAS